MAKRIGAFKSVKQSGQKFMKAGGKAIHSVGHSVRRVNKKL
jgi:hypothetical protein